MQWTWPARGQTTWTDSIGSVALCQVEVITYSGNEWVTLVMSYPSCLREATAAKAEGA